MSPPDDIEAAPKEPAANAPAPLAKRAAPISQLEEAHLDPTSDDGLSAEEAAARLQRFGRNELVEHKTSKLVVFLKLVRIERERAVCVSFFVSHVEFLLPHSIFDLSTLSTQQKNSSSCP